MSALEEFTSLCKELVTYSNHGSYDFWFLNTFKLTPLRRWKWFESFYQRTYSFPFAKDLFLKEIRLDLFEIRQHCKNYYLRTGETDSSAKKAIEMIDRFLERIPFVKKNRFEKAKSYLWKLTNAISIPTIIYVIDAIMPYYPLVLLLGTMALLPATVVLTDKLFVYFSERYWLMISRKRLGIPELKKRIIKDLTDANDNSFRGF